MVVTNISTFLTYYEKTRSITNSVINVIPPDQIDWSYKPGKFTIGDLVRHIAAIERNVFAEVVAGRKAIYRGCGKMLADGYNDTLSYFHQMHKESLEIFERIPDEHLTNKIMTLDRKAIELGNFLRALVVHEVHHRGAMCIYLNMLDVTTPPIIGLTEEQVIELSNN